MFDPIDEPSAQLLLLAVHRKDRLLVFESHGQMAAMARFKRATLLGQPPFELLARVERHGERAGDLLARGRHRAQRGRLSAVGHIHAGRLDKLQRLIGHSHADGCSSAAHHSRGQFVEAIWRAAPFFSASGSGFVNSDSFASLSGTLSFSTIATPASPVGVYAVTPLGR
jgi:hypothetical protein